MSWMKRVLFYFIAISIVIATPLAAITGFYVYRKLTFSYDYCGPYGQIDNEIGWKLKPNTSSCLSLKNYLTGQVYFDTKIYTNEFGFRDKAVGLTVPTQSIAFIGDSWTFGYGVNHEHTFPYLVSEMSRISAVNMGVPGYGSGSTFQLFSRYLDVIKPKIVVYFSGMWDRSLCRIDEVNTSLLPCYFINEKGLAQFAIPQAGVIDSAARDFVYPGGYLTSGYKLRDMLLVLKPRELLQQILSYVGSLGNGLGVSKESDEINDLKKPENLKKILAYEMHQYSSALSETDTIFMLYDIHGAYANVLQEIENTLGTKFVYFGKKQFEEEVASQFKHFPEQTIKVPGDGHFAGEANRLIAKSISAALFRDKSHAPH